MKKGSRVMGNKRASHGFNGRRKEGLQEDVDRELNGKEDCEGRQKKAGVGIEKD